MPDSEWPPRPYDAWRDTYATLHLWSQVVGKVALALAPPLNHSWGIAMQVTSRGLATRPLPFRDGTLTLEFDFLDHVLSLRTSGGDARTLPLVPQTVAAFYASVMRTLAEMGSAVSIWPVAVELPEPIRLDRDTDHHSYDPAFANRFWRILVQMERALTGPRCTFVGKSSPVHFFWGAFDLAVTRFSGRPAPPREGPAFMREAYSHEVISHGFWPGSGPMLEASLYAYAVPEPAGFKDGRVEPAAAYYHRELGEYVLPYEAVRRTASPEQAVKAFVDSTYSLGASLAGWDRAALEIATPPRLA